ncbi:MAG: OB-fold nucleic acid binding domain-containing protein, partial [Spirochaetia bacterium]
MMERTYVSEIASLEGEQTTCAGWVHRIRSLGKVTFVLLRDKTGILQTVWEEAPDLTLESVIKIEGRVEANEKAPGGYEIRGEHIEVLSRAEPDLPVAVNQDPSSL